MMSIEPDVASGIGMLRCWPELEVRVRLVAASVFKTAGPHDNREVGGFDSHALPPFSSRYSAPTRVTSRTQMPVAGSVLLLRVAASTGGFRQDPWPSFPNDFLFAHLFVPGAFESLRHEPRRPERQSHRSPGQRAAPAAKRRPGSTTTKMILSTESAKQESSVWCDGPVPEVGRLSGRH